MFKELFIKLLYGELLMKKLLNEWKKFLNEQEDGGDRREAGAGETKKEMRGQEARERLITWASALQPQDYRKFLQDAKQKMQDPEMAAFGEKFSGAYRNAAKLIVLASKGKVAPKQALEFENMMRAFKIDLVRYGYPPMI